MSHPDPLFDPDNSYEDDMNYDDHNDFYGEIDGEELRTVGMIRMMIVWMGMLNLHSVPADGVLMNTMNTTNRVMITDEN